MKERPILFTGPMVRALLDGSKTQTRRLVKLPHMNPLGAWEPTTVGGPNGGRLRTGETIPLQGGIWHTRTGDSLLCPYGQPGDRLWVRETFVQGWSLGGDGIVDQYEEDGSEKPKEAFYRATSPDLEWCDGGDDCPIPVPWKPSIHMPRKLSRITMEVTGVRVERLQDISEADALAEGVHSVQCNDLGTEVPYYRSLYEPRDLYRMLWESINGPGSWGANPWVWVVEFKREQP